MIVENINIPVDPMNLILILRDEVREKRGKHLFNSVYYRGASNLMFNCPFHKDGQERRPSCSLVLEDFPTIKAGTVKCFSCNYSGSLFDMVSAIFGKRDFGAYGKKWVSTKFNFELLDEDSSLFELKVKNVREIDKKILGVVSEQTYITEEELESYRYYHPYMFERKLTKEVINKYDIGYDPNFIINDKSYECITYPIHDYMGRVYAILRRAIYEKKFFIPPNFEKPVYGVYQLNPGVKRVYITESVMNCLTLAGWGYNAVSLLGLGSDHQLQELKRLNAFVLRIAFDGDSSGVNAAYKLKSKLGKDICTRIVHLPEGKDVNNLTKEEFDNLEETW